MGYTSPCSLELCSTLSGHTFYTATGNDYRGEFRSVEAVWLGLGGGHPVQVSKISLDLQAAIPQVHTAPCTNDTVRC